MRGNNDFRTELPPEFASVDLQNSSEGWLPIGNGKRLSKTYQENDQVERYTIVKLLSSGSVGNVYLCWQTEEEMFYILKTTTPGQSTQGGAMSST